MESKQTLKDYQEKNDEKCDANQQTDHPIRQPNDQTPLKVSYDKLNNSENRSAMEEIQTKQEQLDKANLLIEALQNQLKEANLRIKDLEDEIKCSKNSKEVIIGENLVEKDSITDGNTVGMDLEYCKYTGPIVDGQPHGEGEWQTGLGTFKGMWWNGKREGIHVGKNEEGTVYEFNYKNGQKQGYQKATYISGTVCEYNYKEDNLDGYQKSVYYTGEVHEFNYKDGIKNGFQREKNSYGQTLEYYCKDNNYHGEFKTIYSNGRKEVKHYKNGKLI